jgi:hypothetical protein
MKLIFLLALLFSVTIAVSDFNSWLCCLKDVKTEYDTPLTERFYCAIDDGWYWTGFYPDYKICVAEKEAKKK